MSSPGEKFRIYIAAYLVLERDGQTLLLRRYNTGYEDGKYSLVAGHLEGKESAHECIIREAMEEAGISLNKPKVVHIMHRLASDREYIDVYLKTNSFSGEIKNIEPDKCDDLSWFDTNTLPKNILPEVKFAIENIANGMFYSEFGWPVKGKELSS